MDTTLETSAVPQPRRGLLLIILTAVLWGTVGIATNELFRISNTNPLSLGFFRMSIAAPALGAACWATLGRRMFVVTPRDAGLMLVIAVTMALYQVSFFAAIAQVGVSIAVLVTLCSAPVLVAVLEGVFLHERLTRRVLIALLSALAGTVLLIGGGSSVNDDAAQTLRGVLLALGSSLGYSTMTLCSRALSSRYHPLQPMTWGLTGSAVILFPFALATGLIVTYPIAGWLLLVHLGLIPTALAFVLFLAGIRHTTATVASIVTLVEPLTATVLAWLLFGEQLSHFGFFGAALLVGAIMLLVRRE